MESPSTGPETHQPDYYEDLEDELIDRCKTRVKKTSKPRMKVYGASVKILHHLSTKRYFGKDI